MKNKKTALIFSYIAFSFAFLLAFVLLSIFSKKASSFFSSHPYIMGFLKFALLATAGELLSMRMAKKSWDVPSFVVVRWIIWGFIGIWITYMMKIFAGGVSTLMLAGLLPNPSSEFLHRLVSAFFISATMNLSFGPTFMAIHKCSDTYLDLKREKGEEKVSLSEVVKKVDWYRFVSFTLFKTVPIFWIPAHTVTFLLPSQYQVMLAALLSVALGVILNVRKNPQTTK